ncbi:D-alanyl-D-alanine carboxypeptidase [Alteribacillus persepolensis]|uniref:D-alanyl-D-alanine carboxypeptidase n=1 Tax=Alteribacillus persepolensis TaxID=568899 RepID=A0A1G8JI45_9BACI|nr:M15 family metallopeptidase [Alteribacillus persepolensis]SDI30908.1 D-alanyl-D-alanine carboxypeptidase [Alteribacillus persepolensis]
MRAKTAVWCAVCLCVVSACSAGSTEAPQQEQTNESAEVEPVGGDTPQTDEQAERQEENTDENSALAPPPALNEEGVLVHPGDVKALVNREYLLPADYTPEDLVVPDVAFPFEENHPKKQIREVAAAPLEELFAKAAEEGLSLYAVSGFRSYERQEAIFAANVREDGEAAANQYSAKPGQSEHQSGLAMDVSSPSNDLALTDAFGETPEGKWLKTNAYRFGFIIRYPEGKTDITGYQYEPWHLRYVGKEAAQVIHEEEITLEEYYGVGG